ncbi:MAG: hypothetical protein FIA92_11840 [Chloroflexi bacterium]|nr:hypothetical protein [Chloroflexota bacterium]
MSILAFRRRDPWWAMDGPAARRARRRKRIVSLFAFLISLAAVTGAALAWAVQLGLGDTLGLSFRLALG